MSKILVIDDDEALRWTLDAALKTFGYEVSLVSSGEAGINRAREWMPDLVLCDVNMPGMDGRAVLQAFRNDPALANRQFVLMTGDQRRNPQREGMNLGADDYLPKPFEISQLRTCVDARLRRAGLYRRLEDGMLRRHAELFGSTLPHEFMTPLNGILGFAEILKEDFGKIPQEEARQMLTDIESCARRLHRTLMNYLTLASIESDADRREDMRGAVAAAQSAHIVELAAESLAEHASRTDDLTLEIESVGIGCREGDLRTIVEHLVENAFGFSVPGTPVTVGLRAASGRPVLSVSDKGRGMTAEQISQIGIFTQFERKRFEQQGLGIGLAIVKRLAERCGGKLQLRSSPGQGTTALVEFPPP